MTQRFILLFFFACSLLLPARPVAAQSTAFGLEFRSVAKVVQGTDTLRNAWAGGLDSPQFSSIDLNGDQQNDLFVFDRRTQRISTYLNAAAPGGGRQWQYAPDYAALFPTGLTNWALLRDYDCDGRPDLFASGPNGADIQVYRNVAGANGPTFQLVTAVLNTYYQPTGTATVNITTGGINIPAIADIDGDGRLDILVVDDYTNRFINYFHNESTTACGGLTFRRTSESWGNIQSCLASCASYSFSTTTLCRPGQVQHSSGHNLTTLDFDGDGDQDLLEGRDYCQELVLLRNDGTPQTASMTSAGLNVNFPATSLAVRIPYFPAAYHLDVNFDGRPDLLAAASVYDNLDTIDTRRIVWYYENVSTGNVPNFQYRQQDFLQKDMIEASSLAAPAFLDVDADGRKDLLVAGTRRDGPQGYLVASLAYYRNTGTATRPVYQLITNDYLNLASKKFGVLRPVVADLNRDGAPDLAITGYYALGRIGFMGYYLNQATAGRPASFNINALEYINNLPSSQFDNAAFFDVDNDGYLDLLLGTNSNRTDIPGQSLRYYRNNGSSPLSSAFVEANADYGQIRTATGARPTNLCPVVADFDGDGAPDLVTIDASGQTRLFSNLRAQGSVFVDRVNLFYNTALGAYGEGVVGVKFSNHFGMAAEDVNGDGSPELFIGLESGGVLAAATRNRPLGTRNSTAQALPLQLYPNPAATTATVEAARPVRLTLLDLTGRTVRTEAAFQRRHELDLRGLTAGVYVVRCESAEGQLGVQRLVVK